MWSAMILALYKVDAAVSPGKVDILLDIVRTRRYRYIANRPSLVIRGWRQRGDWDVADQQKPTKKRVERGSVRQHFLNNPLRSVMLAWLLLLGSSLCRTEAALKVTESKLIE